MATASYINIFLCGFNMSKRSKPAANTAPGQARAKKLNLGEHEAEADENQDENDDQANNISSAGSSLADLADMFECPICLGPFSDPRILPACGHHFCHACIKGVAKGQGLGAIKCPTCRADGVMKPTMTIADLPRPVILNRIQARTSSVALTDKPQTAKVDCDPKVYCDPCGGKKEKAVFYCEQCTDNLCQGCKDEHAKSPLFDNHETKDISDITFCQYHKVEKLMVKAFCHTCEDVICGRCALGAHSGHTVEAILPIAQTLRDKVNTAKNKLKANLTKSEASIKEITEYRKQTQEKLQVEKCKRGEIHDLYKEICAELTKIKTYNELDSTKYIGTLNVTLTDLQKKKQLYHLEIVRCEALASCSDVDLVRERSTVPEVADLVDSPPPDTSAQYWEEQNVCQKELLVTVKAVLSQLLVFADRWRVAGTWQLNIEDINELKLGECKYSDASYIRNLPWKIQVKVLDRNGVKYLGAYVGCGLDDKQRKWTCTARGSMSITGGRRHSLTSHKHLPCNNWGWPEFVSWDDLVNPLYGYVTNNRVTIEAQITADIPEAVLP